MAHVKNTVTQKDKTTTTTVTYYKKKGEKQQGRCPVCGKFMGKKGK